MRSIPLLLSAVLIGSSACHSTEPRTLRAIYFIKVPVYAASTDSIHIEFAANTGLCDNNVMVASKMEESSMRFEVTSESGSCESDYPPGIYVSPQYHYVVVPPHPTPFTIFFAEPGQADSSRVVISP